MCVNIFQLELELDYVSLCITRELGHSLLEGYLCRLLQIGDAAVFQCVGDCPEIAIVGLNFAGEQHDQ